MNKMKNDIVYKIKKDSEKEYMRNITNTFIGMESPKRRII